MCVSVGALFIKHFFDFWSSSACLIWLVTMIISSSALLITKVMLIVRKYYNSAVSVLSTKTVQSLSTGMVNT